MYDTYLAHKPRGLHCFPIENSSNKSTKSILTSRKEQNNINEKNLEKATVGISWEIWCSNRETRRFDEKLGDSCENQESWQV